MPYKDPVIRREKQRIASRKFQRKRRAEDPTKASREYKSWQLRSQYGITIEEYEIMLASQKGLCAICNQPETQRNSWGTGVKLLAVDHKHGTKRVRGLLCQSCNMGLGKFGDSPDILKAAAKYLIRAELV